MNLNLFDESDIAGGKRVVEDKRVMEEIKKIEEEEDEEESY